MFGGISSAFQSHPIFASPSVTIIEKYLKHSFAELLELLFVIEFSKKSYISATESDIGVPPPALSPEIGVSAGFKLLLPYISLVHKRL
jgi:hypothetical protein